MNPLKEHWNAAAPRWDATLADPRAFPNKDEAFRRFHWFLKRHVKIGNRTKTFRLLDLGCGTGEASWPLWKRVASVTFFDLSSAMLRMVRNKYEKGIFVRGDASRPPFLDAEFDVVVSRGAVISQLAPERVPKFLTETWRVLRPHGIFVFDFVTSMDAWKGDRAVYKNAWTRKDMEGLVRDTLPGATIKAWDGTDAQALGRVVLTK